jgi:hypothetical protein
MSDAFEKSSLCSNGVGFFHTKTDKELLQLDVGSWFAPEFAGTRFPTLIETVKTCEELGLGIDIEVRINPRQCHKTLAIPTHLLPSEDMPPPSKLSRCVCCRFAVVHFPSASASTFS